jgi:hypothetical protein
VRAAGLIMLQFTDFSAPIDNGSATIRRIHKDALDRLRDFNRYVVGQSDGTASVESLIITARLAMVRDYALIVAQTKYQTVHAALADLDFVMAVYDEEEKAASANCHDELVTAIRLARAAAASIILQQNIRLPGIVSKPVEGVWPSLVVAHKLFADGTRYADVEGYNTHMAPFWLGRDVVAPAG